MAIIKHTKGSSTENAYLNNFPDQFKTLKEKQSNDWIKGNMDYFSNHAYSQYIKAKETFVKNYDLLKGILREEDFYSEPEVKSFTEVLEKDLGLPAYVQHYSIITTPVNQLVGEVSKRPDRYKAKAFDDESKAEELRYKTDMLQQYILSKIGERISMQAAIKGEELTQEDLQERTLQQVQEELDDYTSIAEKWANRSLEALKAEFNIKELGEDAFRDLLASSHEFFHIYEDNSKTGFNVEVVNPKNTWWLTTADKKYIADVTGRNRGAFAAGTVHVMELSEIIERFPEITKKEIDHLRETLQDYGIPDARESNLGKGATGINTIKYDTYDPLVQQTRQILEAEMSRENSQEDMRDFLGITNSIATFGNKYVVVEAYWMSKRKIGRLTYLDEMANEQTTLVDEHYKKGDVPTEIDLEWGWVNEIYRGVKIGHDVYHVVPFKLLPYIPIIGTSFELKNTQSKSLVDLMKPFQVIYNVCMNQLFELLQKEIGKVPLMSIRHVPKPKDGDPQDALDLWEQEARERGMLFVDDSPENTKGASSFNQFTALDLTRAQEIQSRYTLAQQMKIECWELVGLSKQRMASVTSSETATATNTAMQQSYTQTEPWFIAHEYVMGQLYQAMLDAKQYIESAKPNSTLSYITNEGESAFIQVNGNDIALKDLKVFMTNRPEDVEMFNEIRQLSQAIIQNGGSLYEIVEMYSTKSIRELKKAFKDLHERNIKQQEEAQKLQQQQLEQQQQIAQQQLEQQRQDKEMDRQNENMNKELDRINKKEVAAISALKFNENATEDRNNDGVADALQMANMLNEKEKVKEQNNLKLKEINSKTRLEKEKLQVEREKIKLARENQANDIKVAQINARNKNK